VFTSQYILEEFLKYYHRQLELTKQEFITLIDGTPQCGVLKGYLFEDEMHQMLWARDLTRRSLLREPEALTGAEERVLEIPVALSRTKSNAWAYLGLKVMHGHI